MRKIYAIICMLLCIFFYNNAEAFDLENSPDTTVNPVVICGKYDDGSEEGVPVPIKVDSSGNLTSNVWTKDGTDISWSGGTASIDGSLSISDALTVGGMIIGNIPSIGVAVNSSSFNKASDDLSIQAAVDFAVSAGIRSVLIPPKSTGDNVWLCNSAILLPSNITIYIQNTTVKRSDTARDNLFRSSNVGLGISSDWSVLENINIIGLGEAVIEGADIPRSSGDILKTLSLSPSVNQSYGTDAGVSGETQTGDWRDYSVYFVYVNGLEISNIYFKHSHSWALTLGHCSYGQIRNLRFLSTGYINGKQVLNQDGIDIRMGCNNIHISNISGSTKDDMVAITGYELTNSAGEYGTASVVSDSYVSASVSDIHDISVDGVIGTVIDGVGRIMSYGRPNVYNISMENIIGTGGTRAIIISRTVSGNLRNIIVGNVISSATDCITVSGDIPNATFYNVTKTSTTNGNPAVKFSGSISNTTSVINQNDNSVDSIAIINDKLGIGTSTPQNELHVNGSAYVSEDLSVSRNIKSTNLSICSGIVDTDINQNNYNNVLSAIGDSHGTEYRWAQSFTNETESDVTGVRLLHGITFGTPVGGITVKIETDNAGEPSGTVVDVNATSTIASPVSSGYNTYSFTPFTLPAGTYWIVVDCENQSIDSRYSIARYGDDVYSGGNASASTNTVWAAQATTDLTFNLYKTSMSTQDSINIDTDVFVVKASSNVGIGTTNPVEKLDIRGNLNLSASGNSVIFMTDSSGVLHSLTLSDSALFIDGNAV